MPATVTRRKLSARSRETLRIRLWTGAHAYGGELELAGSVLDRALWKREHASLSGFFSGERAPSFPACGRPAGVISVLFTVYPLKQDIQQEVTAKNAKRQKHGKRHVDLTRLCLNDWPGQEKSRSRKTKKS